MSVTTPLLHSEASEKPGCLNLRRGILSLAFRDNTPASTEGRRARPTPFIGSSGEDIVPLVEERVAYLTHSACGVNRIVADPLDGSTTCTLEYVPVRYGTGYRCCRSFCRTM